MKLKQKYYDLLAQHKAKIQEAQTAVEAGELDNAEALTKEAQELSCQIEKVKALIVEQERYGGGSDGEPDTQKGLHIQTDGEESGYQKAVKAFAQAAREGFPARRPLATRCRRAWTRTAVTRFRRISLPRSFNCVSPRKACWMR